MNRRELGKKLAVALGGAAGCACPALAQTMPRSPRIGVLRWGVAGDDAQLSLAKALADIGYRDTQTIAIEWRFASQPDLAMRHARELAGMPLDLIIAVATPAAIALRNAAPRVPVILGGVADPVGAGLVASLARPGGTMTGVSANLPVMVGKQLQLLQEVTPDLQRVAFLGSNDDAATRLFVEQARQTAGVLGLAMQVVLVSQSREFPGAVQAMLRERAQAVLVQPLFSNSAAGPVAELLAQHRLPSITAQRNYAAAGGLMAYGFSRTEIARRTASFVDRVLKGAAPASLPVEEPTAYELVINLKTAKAIGVGVPNSVLLRADEVLQ